MRQQRKVNNFYVFYRISDNGTSNSVKLNYATKINCLKNALNVFKSAKFIVYIDNVIETTDKQIHELCSSYDNTNIKYLNCSGNSKSFRIVYEDALKLNDSDFIYFLEDDYLHLNGSFELLKEFAERNYTDYVTLYDHPDKYEELGVGVNPYCKNFGEKTILFRTQSHHWKITNSTTMTFGAFVDVLRRDKDIFWKYTTDNIPKDFSLFIKLGENNRFLSNPIPSLSTHCNNGSIAPFIDWEKCINNVEKLENTKKCCIVIITHKDRLEGDEERSFKKALDVFGKKRDIKLVISKKISTLYYDSFNSESIFEYVKVDDNWLCSYKAYNKTLCTTEFYDLFKDYNYMLIYQTDCWVFEDRLDEFINLGYDWYGAPWPQYGYTVGNGGFSLRKISKMLEITNKHKNNSSINEDWWFCHIHQNELNICDLKTASNFSLETISAELLKLINGVPMGFHCKNLIPFWDEDGTKFIEYKEK